MSSEEVKRKETEREALERRSTDNQDLKERGLRDSVRYFTCHKTGLGITFTLFWPMKSSAEPLENNDHVLFLIYVMSKVLQTKFGHT